MPGPEYNKIGTRSQSAGATTLTPAKPTVLGQGGILLAVVTTKNNETHSTVTGGWTKLAQINSGASFTASLWIAPEGSSAPVFTWTSSVACSAQIAYYVGVDGPIESGGIGGSTNNNGTTSTHSTAAFNTTKNDALVVYVDVSAANTALAAPAGWTENNDTGSATDAGRTVFGSKAVTTSGTSSGAISVTGAAAAWVQWQVELYRKDGNTAEFSKAEVDAWLDPPSGFSASKIEFAAWLEPGSLPPEGGTTRRRIPIVN